MSALLMACGGSSEETTTPAPAVKGAFYGSTVKGG